MTIDLMRPCKRGHVDRYDRPDGRRECRTCANERKRESYRAGTTTEVITLVPFVPSELPSPMEVAWAAGLFEGEGSICFRPRRGAPALSLSMKDRDVVEHFARVVGCGAISIERGGDFFRWQVANLAAVQWVLREFMPFLGERRLERVERALAHRFVQRRRTA